MVNKNCHWSSSHHYILYSKVRYCIYCIDTASYVTEHLTLLYGLFLQYVQGFCKRLIKEVAMSDRVGFHWKKVACNFLCGNPKFNSVLFSSLCFFKVWNKYTVVSLKYDTVCTGQYDTCPYACLFAMVDY